MVRDIYRVGRNFVRIIGGFSVVEVGYRFVSSLRTEVFEIFSRERNGWHVGGFSVTVT